MRIDKLEGKTVGRNKDALLKGAKGKALDKFKNTKNFEERRAKTGKMSTSEHMEK